MLTTHDIVQRLLSTPRRDKRSVRAGAKDRELARAMLAAMGSRRSRCAAMLDGIGLLGARGAKLISEIS
jgi:hypothetical protein